MNPAEFSEVEGLEKFLEKRGLSARLIISLEEEPQVLWWMAKWFLVMLLNKIEYIFF